MALDRTTILKGPGYITFDGASILSDGDIVATLITETDPVVTSAYGPIDHRVIDKRIEVTVTPKKWTSLGVLFPYATHQVGQSIYGSTDKPLVITTADEALTIANAAVTAMPPLNLRTRGGGSILGQMTFTGLLANSSDPAAAASYYSLGEGGTLPALDLADIKTEGFSATWNSTTIQASEGFQVAWELGLESEIDDAHGTVDMRVQSVGATATCTPRSLTASTMAGLLAFGTGIGAAPTKSDLVITGSGSVSVTLHNCFARQGTHQAGASAHRTGPLEFVAVRTQATGALTKLWTIA